MSLLVDHEINGRLKGTTPLSSGVKEGDFTGPSSPIQAASLDLTIGGIFIPGTKVEELGGAYTPLSAITLAQGHTAVIRTSEKLDLGPDLAGIAFPPASLSVKGLLMTNPGHIDPGYAGPLHITVINMSRLPFPLKRGDRIMRVVFVKLSANPQATFKDRHPVAQETITLELLNRLSVDFLDIETRSESIAQRAIEKWNTKATLIPIGVAAIAFVGTLLAGYQPVRDDIRKLDVRLSIAESKQNSTLEERLQKVEENLKMLRSNNSAR